MFSQVDNIPISLGIGGGVDIIYNKDITSSPLTYHGFGLPVGINGFKLSDKWINRFEAQLILPLLTNNYTLNSRVKTQLVEWTKVSFKYQLLRKIGNSPNYFIGGEIQSNYFYREYDFLDGFGWEFQSDINMSYAQKINLNAKSFILPQLSIPLLGYINRKSSLTYDEEFLDDFNENGAISLLKYGQWKLPFNEWISCKFNILYHLSLSDRLNFQGDIGFNYYLITFPEKVQNINIPIRCYLNYQF